MISRNLYLHLIARVLLLMLTTLAAGYLAAKMESLLISLILLILAIGITINLINYLNKTNRKLSYFLDAIQNEDSSLHFPAEDSNKTVRELFQRLTKVNTLIQQLKIESRQQEMYFQVLLENVATGIITFNSKGFVLHTNAAVKKIFGIHVLTHIRQLERINVKLFQSISHIKPSEQKMVAFATEMGVVQLSVKATSLKVRNDELILLAIQDIRNELDEKESDSWMKLIRVLMHEMMNTIAPIASLSESLGKYYVRDGTQVLPQEVNETMIRATVKGLQVIRDQGNGMMQFVESYRILTRLSTPAKKRFRLIDFLEKMKIIFQSMEYSSGIPLHITVQPIDAEILADENQISQVMLNLMKNALEATADTANGKISIEAGINTENQPEIKIADNGSGIPAEILDQIFVPFFTTRANGSGIGLSLSRQIMQLHGGNLQVSAVPGRETCFTMLFLPSE